MTIKSQLGYQPQMEAFSIHGIDDNHNGMLSNACAMAWVGAALAQGLGEVGDTRELDTSIDLPGSTGGDLPPQC